jgi:pimeloyl-ACP methyl ester carboxylesterase
MFDRLSATRRDVLIASALTSAAAISSARLYWDNAHFPSGGFFDPRGIKIPVAVSAFPDEIYQAPRSWAEQAYPKLIHYNRLPKGGHFAAWEQPDLFTAELRTAFKPLRAST